jgi:hypothetical protein
MFSMFCKTKPKPKKKKKQIATSVPPLMSVACVRLGEPSFAPPFAVEHQQAGFVLAQALREN